MHTIILMSRDALYEAVWSTPINVLAREYGISPARIVAACRELAVPRPEQGHWALAKLGRAPERTPLPAPKEFGPQEVRVYRNDLVRLTTPEAEAVAAPDPGDAAVPRLITATRSALRRAKPDRERGTVSGSGAVLAVVVTPALIDRALQVFTTVLGYARANRWPVSVVERPERARKDHHRKGPFLSHATQIRVDGVLLEMSMEERVRCVQRPMTRAELDKKLLPEFGPNHVNEYHPTGLLMFHIHGIEGTGGRQKWEDTSTDKLENKVYDIASGLRAAAAMVKAREAEMQRRREQAAEDARIAAERAELRRLEQARKEREAARVRHLTELVDQHARAVELRNFIAQVALGPKGEDPAVARWTTWALGVADGMDPVRTGEVWGQLGEPEPEPITSRTRPGPHGP